MDPLTDISTLAVITQEGQPPSWVKLALRGKFIGRDGRSFDVSPETLVERFNADGIPIPIDVDHSTVNKAKLGGDAPAVGWIEELSAREDGLWGRVIWLPEGERILAAKTHRFLSPAILEDKITGKATWLHSASLVAAPALAMGTLASADPDTSKAMTSVDLTIASALGLSADATGEQVAAEITLLVAKSNGFEAHLNALQSAFKSLSSEVANSRSERINQKVEDAIRCGTITPALKDFCITLASSSEELFDQFCVKMGTPFAYLQKTTIPDRMEGGVHSTGVKLTTLNSDATRIANQLGIQVDSLFRG
ncbi:phage protease [Rhizobium lemnae]|uniref:Phage protease n=1 Tax=Rhizobium lemnae TaxID=1214924 RepID=A0ABV8EDR4_9HYPH|nr:phage protease [Rhizobium lemnae]MCJ8510426.1 phage protease [Rhizobium lemnae]